MTSNDLYDVITILVLRNYTQKTRLPHQVRSEARHRVQPSPSRGRTYIFARTTGSLLV